MFRLLLALTLSLAPVAGMTALESPRTGAMPAEFTTEALQPTALWVHRVWTPVAFGVILALAPLAAQTPIPTTPQVAAEDAQLRTLIAEQRHALWLGDVPPPVRIDNLEALERAVVRSPTPIALQLLLDHATGGRPLSKDAFLSIVDALNDVATRDVAIDFLTRSVPPLPTTILVPNNTQDPVAILTQVLINDLAEYETTDSVRALQDQQLLAIWGFRNGGIAGVMNAFKTSPAAASVALRWLSQLPVQTQRDTLGTVSPDVWLGLADVPDVSQRAESMLTDLHQDKADNFAEYATAMRKTRETQRQQAEELAQSLPRLLNGDTGVLTGLRDDALAHLGQALQGTMPWAVLSLLHTTTDPQVARGLMMILGTTGRSSFLLSNPAALDRVLDGLSSPVEREAAGLLLTPMAVPTSRQAKLLLNAADLPDMPTPTADDFKDEIAALQSRVQAEQTRRHPPANAAPDGEPITRVPLRTLRKEIRTPVAAKNSFLSMLQALRAGQSLPEPDTSANGTLRVQLLGKISGTTLFQMIIDVRHPETRSRALGLFADRAYNIGPYLERYPQSVLPFIDDLHSADLNTVAEFLLRIAGSYTPALHDAILEGVLLRTTTWTDVLMVGTAEDVTRLAAQSPNPRVRDAAQRLLQTPRPHAELRHAPRPVRLAA